ncbi:2-amino-4-hydroxy-6-hydroxymethyldihydropteridine pyrophosphokinase [Chloroherpeton thalassium ATCC 35110]|uniref:2-amino-4-hydroxy-6-hydroxymethyldihydropteridine pyrophosphokinase n=1 Tax=Chloroherpeton thalassium (strain ATCC 35110 / GB-78) TaxID=517418 RepID=B3QTI3_CHLT3|nr:2-amino-4-hydroxy-6-hydroxymethyldihydropteridine diphosphokinase [Chloroherpeton thalassium]ACF12729.1 2-amino-4-hydroxy-6-hydroxymethyldihydropteridine pyrophosphokinase [Chloroherpeton thalassium ATCC 35110]
MELHSSSEHFPTKRVSSPHEIAVVTPVFIGLGTNIGNRFQNIHDAIDELRALPESQLAAISNLYETPPLGILDQPSFLNAVCKIDTSLEPEELLAQLKSIERRLGRPETYIKWGPRVIDLDILFYGDLTLETAHLSIPHPEIANRKFVMVPLLDLQNPHHPILGKTIKELLAETRDSSSIIQLCI